MGKTTRRAGSSAAAKRKRPARKAAKRSVAVNDLPPAHALKAALARIVNRRALVSGLGSGTLASTSGVHMAKAKKKAAKPRKAGKKSVKVKNLKAKGAKSKKLGMAVVRRRLV